MSRCLEQTIRRRMALPCVTTFMYAISPAHVIALQHLLDNGEIVARDAPRRAGDPPVLVADSKKAREVLGWAPQHSDLAAIITDAWCWHNKRFGSKGL